MGLIAGVVAAGALAAGASAYSASQQASSQDAANATNANNTLSTNRTNVLLNLISRGAPITATDAQTLGLDPSLIGQSSAVLPYYLSAQEPQLGNNAANSALAIQSFYGSPQLELQDYQNILQGFQPSINNANRLTSDILSGNTTQQMLAEEQPVAAARTSLAQTQKNAALEQLASTLNQIDAIQQQKGYSGDSYGNRLMKFNAARGIATQGAADLGQAALQNALEKQGVQQAGRNLQLNNLSLPGQMAQSEIALKGVPSTAMASRYSAAMQPLSAFSIGKSNFTPFQMPPLVGPNANTGQIVGQTLAGLGNSAGNFMANQSLAQTLNSQNTNGTGASTISPTQNAAWMNEFNNGLSTSPAAPAAASAAAGGSSSGIPTANDWSNYFNSGGG